MKSQSQLAEEEEWKNEIKVDVKEAGRLTSCVYVCVIKHVDI